jgi:predicted esterase
VPSTGEDAGSGETAGNKLPPLSADGQFAALEVEGHLPATVSLPLGTTEPRPVVVALHGNFDRPEWQCDVWRDITAGYPFVLCPRGMPRTDVAKSLDRWTYAGGQPAEKELLAALEALEQRFAEYIAPGPIVYTGFSLGAIIGVSILRKHPERFQRAVLIEGGNKRWSRANARAYAQGGGKRVMFACGQVGCQHLGRQAARLLEAEGVEVKVGYNGTVGHTYDGKVADAVAERWVWLVQGDERWPAVPLLDSEADAADN